MANAKLEKMNFLTGLKCSSPWIWGMLLFLLMAVLPVQVRATEFPFEYVDKFIDELSPHAKRYPPQFESTEQKEEMVNSLKKILVIFDNATDKIGNDKEILFRYAFLNAMGHNLDLPGCAEKSINGYLRIMEIDPNDKRANYYFGTFLVGTKLIDKSIPYLQKAILLGEQEAHYPLAFVYLKQKRNEEALMEFNSYLDFDPDNETAKQMVGKLKSGKVDLDYHYSN